MRRFAETMIKDVLGICPGITAVIGSGGKTTLIGKLAEELSSATGDATGTDGTHSPMVVICTTTHIMRPDDMPVFAPEASRHNGGSPVIAPGISEYGHALEVFLRENTGRPVCIGLPDPENPAKLISFPIEEIQQAAGENACILVEADGSKHLPLKAHNENEPVIPNNCSRVILVIGARGFGMPVAEAVHRPEIFAKLAKTDIGSTITPEAVAAVINAERNKFGSGRLQIFVNSETGTTCDIPVDSIKIAKELAALTGLESYAGCAKSGVAISC